MDLTTNGVIVNDALKYIQSKMEHLNSAEKQLLQDINEDAEVEPEEPYLDGRTTNGIF
jgi:hypothetical protein